MSDDPIQRDAREAKRLQGMRIDAAGNWGEASTRRESDSFISLDGVAEVSIRQPGSAEALVIRVPVKAGDVLSVVKEAYSDCGERAQLAKVILTGGPAVVSKEN